jgi:NAD(P)-dependent dehydrogenase (short-subunit alcohol dehydrogenase family)
MPTDVVDADQTEATADAVEEEFGPIDVWVNNAMTSLFSPVDEMDADEHRLVTEVTYLACVYGTQTALDRMRLGDEGTIVLVGSALAYRGPRPVEAFGMRALQVDVSLGTEGFLVT